MPDTKIFLRLIFGVILSSRVFAAETLTEKAEVEVRPQVELLMLSDEEEQDRVQQEEEARRKKISELVTLTTLNPEQFEKAGFYLLELKKMGFGIKDLALTEVTNFLELREALEERGTVPSDETIFNDLYKTWMNFVNFQTRAYVQCPTQLGNLAFNQLQLKKVGKRIDFEGKFAQTQVPPTPGCFAKLFNVSPDMDFYKKIYKALNKNSLLDKAQYPDESNGEQWNKDRQKKKDHLIHFLASIKYPDQTQDHEHKNWGRYLTDSIQARSSIYYPTKGLPEVWFSEIRYKLFYISKVIPSLNDKAKVTVLSYLLHAGANCNDAKKNIIDELFNTFCKKAAEALQLEEESLASSLKDRIQLIAVKEKEIILDRMIKTELEKMIQGMIPMQVGRKSITRTELEKERLTVYQATWDVYAPVYGLHKKQAFYDSYAIAWTEDFTGKGNYSPAHLYQVVSHKHADIKGKILDEYLGWMKILFPDPEAVVLGALQELGFLDPAW